MLLALAVIGLSNAATTHKHDHHGHKERLEDGSFSPRDAHHHSDGGEHNVEFDHEAILGNFAGPFDNGLVLITLNVCRQHQGSRGIR